MADPVKDKAHNHLVEPIACLLESASAPLSEYALIQQLQAQNWLESGAVGDNLALYATHFLVYNALYQLAARYRLQGQYLQISALEIALVDMDSIELSSSKALSGDSQTELVELEAYYLNWDNLEQATLESVEALLNSFWQRMVAPDDYRQALEDLGLSHSVSYDSARKRYRELAMQHHPDRGGDTQQFQAIQQAFAVVQRHWGRA